MKYPLIPIKKVIDGVPGGLPRMSAMNMIDEDQLYQWAVECIRMISTTAYTPRTVYLRIKNTSCALPKEMYLCQYVVLCSHDPEFVRRTIWFTQEELKTVCVPMGILRPSDSIATMVLHVSDFRVPGIPVGNMSYMLRRPPGIIKTSFKEGIVQFNYLAFPLDEDGNICMADEEYHAQAVDTYCKIKLIEESYLMGQVNQNVWDTFNNRFDDYLTNARNNAMALSEEEMHHFILQQNQRYSMFNLSV